jgi:hypothetical protein
MMYYVEGDKILDNQYCTTYGPPSWYFKNFKVKKLFILKKFLIPKLLLSHLVEKCLI